MEGKIEKMLIDQKERYEKQVQEEIKKKREHDQQGRLKEEI